MSRDRNRPDPATIARLKELTDLSDDEVRQVAEAGRLVHVPANWSLIWDKTPADAAYFILEGTVSITRGGEEVASLGAGDFIGEAAIVNSSLRSAAVITDTEVTALNFSAEEGRALAQNIPAVGEAIRAKSAERLADNQGG